jgi:hypothetical protein
MTLGTIPSRDPWENESSRMNAAIPERRPATEEISGVIERVTFHNDESGFCVLRKNGRELGKSLSCFLISLVEAGAAK